MLMHRYVQIYQTNLNKLLNPFCHNYTPMSCSAYYALIRRQMLRMQIKINKITKKANQKDKNLCDLQFYEAIKKTVRTSFCSGNVSSTAVWHHIWYR